MMKIRLTFVLFCFSLLSVNGQTGFLTNPKVINQIIDIATNSSIESTPLTPAESIGADALWLKGYGYEGDGLYAGVWEAGGHVQIDETLTDLKISGGVGSRVTIIEAGSSTTHTNTVARVIASDGSLSPTIDKGIAPKSKLLSYNLDANTYLADMASVAYPAGPGNNILVANNSFAANSGWNNSSTTNWNGVYEIDEYEDFRFGRYSDATSIWDNIYDQTISQNPFLTIVKAAGNDRGVSGTLPYNQFFHNGVTETYGPGLLIAPDKPENDGGIDGFDCIPYGAIGKNIITVGVCDQLNAPYTNKSQIIIGTNSGFGPTDDGRIKPDLIAPYDGGKTSYSTPIVSGVVLLVQEMYENQSGNSDYMKASTVKALLCHTAFEADNDGPDYKTGWGMVNAKDAGQLIEDEESNNAEYIREQSLTNGITDKFFYYIDANASEAKITLAWTDPEGTPTPLTYTSTDLNNPASMLVNDLDVRLKQICLGTEFQPYILDPSNPSFAATTGDNTRDNIEQIHQQSLDAGWYVIEVSHKGILAVAQDYSLIVEGFETPNRWTGSWSKGAAPTSTEVVSVESNLPVGATKIEANHVFIADGVTITANTSEELEISGNLTTDGSATFLGDGELNLINDNALICGNLNVSNLVLAKGANTATIEAANSLLEITEVLTTESGTLTTNGNLKLIANSNSNQEGYAQILDNGGSISGDVVAQAYIIGNSDWRHIASPVTTTLNDFLKDYSFYKLTGQASAYVWNNSTSNWDLTGGLTHDVDEKTPLNLFFGSSSGIIFTNLPHLIELTGAIHTGNVSNSLVYNIPSNTSDFFDPSEADGWNMIANPYPSGLEWSQITGGFGSVQINGSYYIYNEKLSQYSSHNGSIPGDPSDLSVNGIIAPNQAFFVKLDDASAEGSGVLNLTNTDRTATKSKFLKKEEPVLFLKVKDQNNKLDYHVIAFNEIASHDYDSRFDAYKLKSPNPKVPTFYSSILKKGVSMKSSINTMPLPTDKSVIPLGFESKFGGSQTISLDSFYLDNPLDIWLLDKLTKSRTNLLQSSYQFVHNPTNPANRFALFLGPDLSEEEITLSDDPLIYIRNESLIISGFETSQRIEISVFNMLGQTIFDGNYIGSEAITIPLDSINASGAVIVSFKSGKTILREKLILPN